LNSGEKTAREAGRFLVPLEAQGTLAVVIWNGAPGTAMLPAYSMPMEPVGCTGQPFGAGQAPPSEKITGP
jgi:hypothetical protein